MVEIKISDFIAWAWKIAKNKTNWFNRIFKMNWVRGKGKICLWHMKLNF